MNTQIVVGFRRLTCALIFLIGSTLLAQNEVTHADDFQSYGMQANPPGWVDSSVGSSRPTANGLFKTWPDPLDGSASNVVFGTRQASGKPDGTSPRVGTFSTFTSVSFDGKGRFVYRGRMLRTTPDSRIGLTFFSSYPEKDSYYLIALWRQPASADLTLQLVAFGGAAPGGKLDSGFTPDANTWYEFLIQVDDVDDATHIRARFWRAGTPEPTAFSIESRDTSPGRLTGGRVGVWAAVRGDAFYDDLSAKSPVDHTPPEIQFVDITTQQVLDHDALALFSAPARIDVRIEDDLSSIPVRVLQLDGADYSGDPIATDGRHVVHARAVDAVGNTSEASLELLVDQVPPTIALLANAAPITAGAVFAQDVTLSADVVDLSDLDVTSSLNGSRIALPAPVAEEREHLFSVNATDQVGWTLDARASFFLDKSAPVITLTGNGVEFPAGHSFKEDVSLSFSADDLTLASITATLDGAPVQGGAVVTTEAVHDVAVTATDRAGHTTTTTRQFVLRKGAAEVRLLANGVELQEKTYASPVVITAEIIDPTPTTHSSTLDGASYLLGTEIAGQGSHTFSITARNAAGFETKLGPLAFSIDLEPPSITVTESGQPFVDGAKFGRDVLPVVSTTDNLAATPTKILTLNGVEYPLETPITEEKAEHSIVATATDDGGNQTVAGPIRFVLDKTAPVVAVTEEATGEPFAADALYNRPVRIRVRVEDLTSTTLVANVDGAPLSLSLVTVQSDGSRVYISEPVAGNGPHGVSVLATDSLGWQSAVDDVRFTIDTIAPAITFVEPVANATLTSPSIFVRGNADDAVSLTINGRDAFIDHTVGTFALQGVDLLEGPNEIIAVATDQAGNVATSRIEITLDTRGPDLSILAPAGNVCTDATSIEIRGIARDRQVAGVTVTLMPAAVVANAVVAADGLSWSATLPLVNEGRVAVLVEATDSIGHKSAASTSLTSDRSAPSIEILEAGAPFAAAFVRRTVALFSHVTDVDTDVVVTTTLNGQPYASGAPIEAERLHELKVIAIDCAGHRAEEAITFTVDRTPPELLSISPESGSTVGAMPRITGTTSLDATGLTLQAGSRFYPVVNGSFTIADAPLVHGTNDLLLSVVDAAGNSSESRYRVTLKLTTPSVEIVESGVSIATDAVFNRTVMPVIRATERDATIAATLNGNPYASGTPIAENGSYTLVATASDEYGHTSEPVTVTFRIDRTAPIVAITTPAQGSRTRESMIEVRGTTSGDVRAVTVSGITAVTAPDSFSATVPLEFGPNTIVATAIDPAGNTSSATVEVIRGDERPALVLTAPSDGTLTNRQTTVVAGQLLTVDPAAIVTINGTGVDVDPSGFFRRVDFPLDEGLNSIVAEVRSAAAETSQVTVRVTADRVPPRVRLFESGQPLADAARFSDDVTITAEANDGATQLQPEVRIDAELVTLPASVTTAGGHIVTALARDAAGNEARIERTFYIGGSGPNACNLDAFDPPSGTAVTSDVVMLAGRTGGAVGVLVNGTPAIVSGGSFCATVGLPAENENVVTIVCTDADGNPTGTPERIIIQRITNAPTISIIEPAENAVVTTEAIHVSGAAGGAASVEVNGVPATFVGDTFSIEAARLVPGLNVIAVRARNAAGRTSASSRRVTFLKDAPMLTVTSPAVALTTGIGGVDVSGTWANVDPATIQVSGLSSAANVRTRLSSDTSGTFVASDVPLVPGEQTITVVARDRAGRSVETGVSVTLAAGSPGVAITTPEDNRWLGVDSPNEVVVSGTFAAAAGSTVDVAGIPATIDVGTSTFTATVPIVAGRVTPILARVIEPAGSSTIDVVRVTKAGARPAVVSAFPADQAVQVDAGAMPMVLFSMPMERTTIAEAFRLENAAGSPVSGELRLDRDVLTFAPSALLTPGARYTMRLLPAAASNAGDALGSDFISSFFVASTAPLAAPVLAPVTGGCSDRLAISGTAAAGARLQIDFASMTFTTTASPTGEFSYALPVGGYRGHQVVRVRIAGIDGSLSPAAESCVVIDCAGPQVISANFDRPANHLTVAFSKEIDADSATTDSVKIRLNDGRVVGSTISASMPSTVVAITPAEDLSQATFVLEVTTAITDLAGAPLAFPHSQEFAFESEQPPAATDGTGLVSGEVFDAATGRPLPGALISIDSSDAAADARGRYAARLPEGARTIRASAPGYTTVWRQIVVPAGAGVVPIDIRLTPLRAPAPAVAGEFVDGDVRLKVPAGAVSPEIQIGLTAIAPQSLPGLLPLGWSPLASAVVHADVPSLATSYLEFTVPYAEIVNASQLLTAVRYHEDTDEWRVVVPVVNVAGNGVAVIPISVEGAYALVYRDQAAGLRTPADPVTGAALAGVRDACSDGGETCPPLFASSFVLDPPVVLPTEKTLATLTIEGLPPAIHPSGTAVQAYIDEELRAADGTRLTDPPFTTDLVLYRNLSGETSVAQFQLSPSGKAAQIILDIGFDHIRILPYPGRLDRGSLIGPEGGRVPGDGRVIVEIPAAAATEPLRVSAMSIDDFSPFGSIAGFEIVAGVSVSLQRVSAPDTGDIDPPAPQLLDPARVTFASVTEAGEYVLVEVLESTPYGRIFRLASRMDSGEGSRVITRATDRNRMAVDGVVREGRYLLLKADAPIAFVSGGVRDPNGTYLRDARVTTPLLGVADVTRPTGTYAITVPATPAAPFALQPRSTQTGDGAPYLHPISPAAGEEVRVDLGLVAQAPRLVSTEPNANGSGVELTAFIRATFDVDLDRASIDAAAIHVVDANTRAVISGAALLETPRTVLWKIAAGKRFTTNSMYIVTVAPTIRGSNGAPFGRTHTFRFSTQDQFTSSEVHPERIRITIPDENGHSRVVGAPGALPPQVDAQQRWIAMLVRRGHDFTTRFQAQPAADGSFVIDINEAVQLTDAIDLHAINAAGSVAAIVPLTPFATEDGHGFIAPGDRTVTFRSDVVNITVPAGAFDKPTLITSVPVAKSAFQTVPSFDQELNFYAGLAIDFDGESRLPLELEIPVPAGTTTEGVQFLLGRLGDSVRGPRIEIDDTLRIEGGMFVTRPGETNGARTVETLNTFTGQKVKDYLMRVHSAAQWVVLDIKDSGAASGFVFMQGLDQIYDMFWDSYHSLYVSNYYLTASRGRVVFPTLTRTPFVVEGVDTGTGLTGFRTSYSGVDPPEVGTATGVASPVPNQSGPYPVFADPLYVQVIDLHAPGVAYVPSRGIQAELALEEANANVSRTTGGPEQFGVLNLSGVFVPVSGLTTKSVAAAAGDRLVVFGSTANITPTTRLQIVFNEPLDEDDLADHIVLEKFENSPFASDQWLGVALDLEVDSGGRRVWLNLRGELQRGGRYRVVLRATLADGHETPKTLGHDLVLEFTVREPQGDILGAPFSLPDGSVRDMALDGNLLFVSATEGDLLAYDVSDPAVLKTKPPIARASAPTLASSPEQPVDIPGETWAVTIDVHGRIWTTALTDMFGVIRSYRIEDFARPPAADVPTRAVQQVAASIVSWRTGINVGLPLGTTWAVQSDRPESIPRKLQVATQDESFEAGGGISVDVNGEPTIKGFGGNQLGALAAHTGRVGEYFLFDVTIPRTAAHPPDYDRFRSQRVTVINTTIQLRWSADFADGASTVTVPGVMLRNEDRILVMRNFGTYAVVSHVGYGIGFYDLNAIEHNQKRPGPEKQYAEQLALTEALRYDSVIPNREAPPCDESEAAPGLPCGPRSLTYVTDATLLSSSDSDAPPTFNLYGVETRKGLVDVSVVPIPGSPEPSGSDPSQFTSAVPFAPNGSVVKRERHLAFTGRVGSIFNDHPRLTGIRRAFADANRILESRFTGIARFDHATTCFAPDGTGTPCTKPYGLVAANQFGILVVDLTPPIDVSSLADVIWLPAGAYGVRHIAGSHYATAVDGQGRSMLIDLSRIDERAEVPPLDLSFGCALPCAADMFPTVRKALHAGPSGIYANVFGSDDPRIIWKGETDLDDLYGTLAPVADPDTGFIYSGDLLEETIHVLSGLDPRITIKAMRDGAMTPVDAVVPLGIPPPAGFQPGELGAFRIEVALPGSIAESLGDAALSMRIESQRMSGVRAGETPAGWPAAHESVLLRRIVPPSSNPTLRYQKGWNFFVSDPVVAIADPRAANAYAPAWGNTSAANKEKEGCWGCEAPPWAKHGPDSVEVYSLGRLFRIYADPAVFRGAYSYLADAGRFEKIIGTVMADTIRPTFVQIAAQNPPVAGGMLQETTYLHSGEVETSAVDLDAGGRNGWNVTLDRTYRSRTIGWTPLGMGWDASYLKRLRPLPNGNVEFRDGSGEVWTFRKTGVDYVAPDGVFLKLTRTDREWKLRDPKSRIITFDDHGRVLSESDEFFDPAVAGSGNRIAYVYGADGLLSRIIDPVQRVTKFTWDDGFISQVDDWRSRAVNYEVREALLKTVNLVDVVNVQERRPRIEYSYQPWSGGFADRVEIGTNLQSITDPTEAVTASGKVRVRFLHQASGSSRDRVYRQEWGTGEFATLAYPTATEVHVTDVLGQERKYTLDPPTSDIFADRVHVRRATDVLVPVWAGASFGALPTTLPVGPANVVLHDVVSTAEYEHGMVKKVSEDGVRETSNIIEPAIGAGGWFRVGGTTTAPHSSSAALSTNSTSSLLPAVTAITRRFRYQPGSNFLSGVEEDGYFSSSVEPHWGERDPVDTNNEVRIERNYDANGLLRQTVSSGGNDPTAHQVEAKEVIEYWDQPTDPEYKRGLPRKLIRGKLVTAYDYTIDTTIETDEDRKVRTTTTYDAWRRPVRVETRNLGKPDDLVVIEESRYDATGRLRLQVQQKGATLHFYDEVGRNVRHVSSGVDVEGGVLETETHYDLASGARTITTMKSGGATTVTTLDRLGRTERVTEIAGEGSSNVDQYFGYDIDGNRVYVSDGFTSTVQAFDAHGRMTAARYADGTVRATDFGTWSRPKTVKQYDANAVPVGESTYTHSEQGRLVSVATKVDTDVERKAEMRWDGAGRTTSSAVNGRVAKSEYDDSGRLIRSRSGSGSLSEIEETFITTSINSHDGTLPTSVTALERNGTPHTAQYGYDTIGNRTRETRGDLEWTQKYDTSGHLVSSAEPDRPAATYETDSRGAIGKEVLPDGAINQYKYDRTGAASGYTDPTQEATTTTNDLLGRPLRRDYPDGTSESYEYEGSRIKSTTDRRGRKQVFAYNAKGQLYTISNGDGVVLDAFAYDDAGRMVSWMNRDSEVTWGGFDAEARPKTTTQKRFAQSVTLPIEPLSPPPVLLDEYSQEHRWNVHGERTAFSMPIYPGLALGEGWTKWLVLEHDAAGNITSMSRAVDPTETLSPLMSADFRSAGRPVSRTIFTADNVPIGRTYGYDEQNGLMNRFEVTTRGLTIGGSQVERDGLQVSSQKLLGLSGGRRVTMFTYDDRSRLVGSAFAVLKTSEDEEPSLVVTKSAREKLTPADFREGQERQQWLDTEELAKKGVDTSDVDPPSTEITESAEGGHKIDKITRGPNVYEFDYANGPEVVDDGRFLYVFDQKGRLITATEKTLGTPIRRVKYVYSGPGRLIGRRAEYATVPSPDDSAWRLEDRPEVLAADGLPANTTFVWDAISDNLITVAHAGATMNHPHGGIVKQILHGGLSYDDPIETMTVDSQNPSHPKPLYGVWDEVGAGHLEAVLNRKGELIARNVTTDPYGHGSLDLLGPAVDRITLKAKKGSDGELESVEISIGATEELLPASIPTGTRLAALDSTNSVLRLAPAVATLVPADKTSAHWSLTGDEWTAFTAGASSISIGVTNQLRATLWGDQVFLSAPEWARTSMPIRTEAEMPIEVRAEPMTASDAANTTSSDRTPSIYWFIETPALVSASSQRSPTEGLLMARMHAHPIMEPLTDLSYVRDRWYDGNAGSFLTADPLGFRDSSDLYAFCGGDPVNGRDPTGMWQADFHYYLTMYLALRAGYTPENAQRVADGAERPDQDDRSPIKNWLRFFIPFSKAERQKGIHTLVDWHFPKSSYHSDDEVIPGSGPARGLIDAGTALGLLDVFAEGLHPFQDSWSHQGKPTWFGWAGHRRGFFPTLPMLSALDPSNMNFANPNGDIPAQNQLTAYQSAQAVYTELIRFKRANPAIVSGLSNEATWGEIEGDVKEFVALRERWDKQQWMKEHLAAAAGRPVDVSQYWNDVTPGVKERWLINDELNKLRRLQQ